jgi:uncharacterized protein YcfJ
VTSQDKLDLTVAIVGGIIGGIVGHFVSKKSHPVVGTIAGVAVGALAVPGTVEAVRQATS